MSIDPPGNEPLLETRCSVCGAALTPTEIETAQDAGRPFLCTTHATEELPAIEDELAEG